MQGRKILGIIFIFSICSTNGLSHISETELSTVPQDLQDSHLIEGVPYIPQTAGYFCYYATCTMIFKYLGINTSLNEVLFLDGIGYKHRYVPEERLPDDGCYLGNFDFVLDLFGVHEYWWSASNDNISNEECWNQYYTRLKENISNDIPIITRVDPFSMPSFKEQFKISDSLWTRLFQPSHHVIVIVGYNESNQSICYNDPNAGFYGENSYGDYAWITLSDFRKAVEITVTGWNRYIILTFKYTGNNLTKNDIFEKAIRYNSEKLKGNLTAYYFQNNPRYQYYGINASKELKDDFSDLEENRLETINLYRQFGGKGLNYTLTSMMQRFFSILFPNKPNLFDIFMVGKKDSYASIAAEKKFVANYLEKCQFYPEICRKHSSLLIEESKYWNELSYYYKTFMRRGIYLSQPRAVYLMSRMEKTIDRIISIEQEIIDTSMI
jgi:hypothetical protein